jgi:hypothetical protein
VHLTLTSQLIYIYKPDKSLWIRNLRIPNNDFLTTKIKLEGKKKSKKKLNGAGLLFWPHWNSSVSSWRIQYLSSVQSQYHWLVPAAYPYRQPTFGHRERTILYTIVVSHSLPPETKHHKITN